MPVADALLASALRLGAALPGVRWCAFAVRRGPSAWRILASAGRGAPAPDADWQPAFNTNGTTSGTTGAGRRSLATVDVPHGRLFVALSRPRGRAASDPTRDPSAAPSGATQRSVSLLAGHLTELLSRQAPAAAPSAASQNGGPAADEAVLPPDAIARRLEEELERTRRYGGEFSILLIYLAGIAHLRERDGQAAERALLAVGGALQERRRQMDVVGRRDQESFLVVLPETRAAEALQAGSRILAIVEEALGVEGPAGGEPSTDGATSPLVRIGASTYPAPAASAAELVEQAETVCRRNGDSPAVEHWLEGALVQDGFTCVCRRCGKVFAVEDRSQQRVRRYCSHSCYIAARRAEEKERDDAILALRAEGLSLREIGRRFKLTAERVRQISQRAGSGAPQ